jgi:alkylhydroperoxidase family enzyme
MTVKANMSRFDIHDELTAPEGSERILKSVSSAGGAVSKFIGVLAVAERRGDGYSIAQHARTARAAGLGLDEISSARGFASRDAREAALLAFLESLLDSEGHPELYLLEEAREIGWTDEQILEAIAHVALGEFQSLVANAAALPQDQSDPSILPKAA